MSVSTEQLHTGVLLFVSEGSGSPSQREPRRFQPTAAVALAVCGWEPGIPASHATTSLKQNPSPPLLPQSLHRDSVSRNHVVENLAEERKTSEQLLTAGVFGGIKWKGACSWTTKCEASTLTFSPKPAFDDFYPRQRTLQTFWSSPFV